MRKIVIPLGTLLALVVGALALAHSGQAGPRRTITVLKPVLADLVEDGTITPEQSVSIVSALEERKPCGHRPVTRPD